MKETMNILDKISARYLRFTGKESYAKIAKKLGLKPGTIRRYLKPIERKGDWKRKKEG